MDLRGKTERQKRIWALALTAAVFLLLVGITELFLPDVYLFEWGVHNRYWYVWVVPFVLILLGRYGLSAAVTVGFLVGMIVGQAAGDLLVAWNTAKITPDMGPGEVYQLTSHKGVFIWLGTILVFGGGYLVIKKVRKKP